MNDIVFKTLKEKDYIIKPYLIRIAKELNLSLNEFILLIYFYNQEEPVLNIEQIKNSTSISEEEIMASFTRLTAINIIDVKMLKDDKGIKKEVISLDNIIRTITTDITKDIKNKEESTIYSEFESEFGRPLSRMEYEIINDWLDSKINPELIMEALRLAVYNGTLNFRYISAILTDWQKKGYKSKSDLSKGLKTTNDDNSLTDLLESNWLDEN